jgi:beta-lactamase class A
MRVRKVLKIVGVLLCAAVVATASVITGWKIADQHNYKARHLYPLLDPSVSNPEAHPEVVNFDPLRQDLKKYLGSLKMQHSFYFEYLPNGVSIRDGDENNSQAASLLKTPLVMDLYKLAEQGKVNLDGQSTIQPVFIDTDPNWGNPTHLKVGDTITLRQAADIALKHSSNTALNVLKDRLEPLVDKDSDSFRSLDIAYTTDSDPNNPHAVISSRSYSSILKCLYYACFNNANDSTQILKELIDSAAPQRLAAGVDPSVKVAHKIGSGGYENQSDCGIVYYPNKPYMLCLMFFNVPQSAKTDPYFQHVSKMIYDYIDGNS